jgi:hypothetical protein
LSRSTGWDYLTIRGIKLMLQLFSAARLVKNNTDAVVFAVLL